MIITKKYKMIENHFICVVWFISRVLFFVSHVWYISYDDKQKIIIQMNKLII